MGKNFKKLIYMLLNKEIAYYIIFGVLTTLVDTLAFYFSNTILNLNYIISTNIAWLLAVMFAYVTNRKWVFKSKAKKLNMILKEFLLFIIARLVSLGLTIIWMLITVELLNSDEFLAKLLANFFVIVINYIFSKIYIFKK